jgi:Ala-tRNA(Pro) deacylase
MPTKRMREYLNKNNVRYVTVEHSPAYTAEAVAASAHIPAKEMAKTVMIEIDGMPAMAVIPASFHADLEQLRAALDARHISLLRERDFKDRFPDCEPGAMPPFGNLYGMPVFVSESLAEDEYVAFSAGSHNEVVLMAYADYERLVAPRIVKFSAETLAL